MRGAGESRDDAPEAMAIGVYGMVHGLDTLCPGVMGGVSTGR
jgi:hypothetical protein